MNCLIFFGSTSASHTSAAGALIAVDALATSFWSFILASFPQRSSDVNRLAVVADDTILIEDLSSVADANGAPDAAELSVLLTDRSELPVSKQVVEVALVRWGCDRHDHHEGECEVHGASFST